MYKQQSTILDRNFTMMFITLKKKKKNIRQHLNPVQ